LFTWADPAPERTSRRGHPMTDFLLVLVLVAGVVLVAGLAIVCAPR
jgi:hypothetical protein